MSDSIPEPLDPQLRAKVDEIVKYLFSAPPEAIIPLLNTIFHLSLDSDNVTLRLAQNEFIDEFRIKIPDLVMSVTHTEGEEQIIHIEVQTRNSSEIHIRMFNYGYHIANSRSEEKNGHIILRFPKQVVIFIEENSAIPDTIGLTLILPDESEAEYRIPTFKLWDFTPEEFIHEGLHILLPLCIFRFRKKLESLKISGKLTKQEIELVGETMLQRMSSLISDVNTLYLHGKIDEKTRDIIFSATKEISKYINGKYLKRKPIQKKVTIMIKSVMEEVKKEGYKEGVEKGRMEGIEKGRMEGMTEGMMKMAKKLLARGMDPDDVSEMTELPKDLLLKIQS
ncbi:MAG: Rpn family recombination-promoting nuclease/putative transposase [Methanobacteriota archaeon]